MSPARLPRAPADLAMAKFRQRLRTMSSRPELLYDLMGFGHYGEMALTRTGMLVARSRRATGFDTFIGAISAGVLQRTSRLWLELTSDEKALVIDRLIVQGIDPALVGITTLENRPLTSTQTLSKRRLPVPSP
jgi:hypothetical protein